MKVVLLAGGFGTRLSEYTKTIPKPMINVGGQPILLHIMKLYAKHGFKNFYIASGSALKSVSYRMCVSLYFRCVYQSYDSKSEIRIPYEKRV